METRCRMARPTLARPMSGVSPVALGGMKGRMWGCPASGTSGAGRPGCGDAGAKAEGENGVESRGRTEFAEGSEAELGSFQWHAPSCRVQPFWVFSLRQLATMK